ncbi:hypothetical protein EVAR_68927_1 [Eumeta japonica]|uniref:Uncharacterized protein n=1 Tax=Eumeta variegata TaxID=151549 RepID=A0A4C2ABR8_EUMVA|nr:hypothetical protein EVAR_68927_1 [Eumeta japonica]
MLSAQVSAVLFQRVPPSRERVAQFTSEGTKFKNGNGIDKRVNLIYRFLNDIHLSSCCLTKRNQLKTQLRHRIGKTERDITVWTRAAGVQRRVTDSRYAPAGTARDPTRGCAASKGAKARADLGLLPNFHF